MMEEKNAFKSTVLDPAQIMKGVGGADRELIWQCAAKFTVFKVNCTRKQIITGTQKHNRV